MVCLDGCAFVSTDAARRKVWSTYGGKDDGDCVLTEASQPAQPTYVLNIDATGSASDATLEGESRGVDAGSADRLHAALRQRAQPLLACVGDLQGPAKVEFTLRAQLTLADAAHYGLEQRQLQCLAAELRQALAGVDFGQARLLRIRFRRPYPTSEAASEHSAEAPPSGSLSKSVIADVIADHIGEIRRCYEDSLAGWPQLAGRVAVKFIIQPDGSVDRSAVAETTLHHKPTECCITNAVRSWQYPPPDGGGIVVVTYPFVLEQG